MAAVFEQLEPRMLLSGLLPGDANRDGIVDVADYAAWYNSFGTGTTWEQANFKGEGITDVEDYATWFNHFGDHSPTPDTEVSWYMDQSDLIVIGTDAADTITLSKSGDDTVIITPTRTLLVGSFANIEIYGFDGDDLLVSIGGAAETVYGGLGFDSFWADSLDTLPDVDATEQAVSSVHRVVEFYQPSTDPVHYISLELAGQDLLDPTGFPYVTTDYSEYPLFTDGPDYDDPIQGNADNCYFIAALSSLAHASPMVIEQMIAPMGDGTYAVRFYRDNEPLYVRVDAGLYELRPDALMYAKLSPDDEMWVVLVEKAYAQFHLDANSYAEWGGDIGSVYMHLTNLPTYSILPAYEPPNALGIFIADTVAAGVPISAASRYGTPGPIEDSHAYAILSAENVDGEWQIGLYNPWGYSLSISIDVFVEQFAEIYTIWMEQE